MIDATHIRKGMIIIMDGTLYRVMEMQLITPGRGGCPPSRPGRPRNRPEAGAGLWRVW